MKICSKKIEEIGKMTALTQEEIVSSTKTVIQGLEALRNEHNQVSLVLAANFDVASWYRYLQMIFVMFSVQSLCGIGIFVGRCFGID